MMAAPRIDADFALEVLDDLYSYRRKRASIAWLLWALFGWLGAHRFYLGRDGTGLLMLFTGGGGLLWWAIDGLFVGRMVRAHNDQQAQRERAGLPPIGLEFMPPLRRDVLRAPPDWYAAWLERGRLRRALRLAGDLLVLLVAGTVLGALANRDGGAEGIVAVFALCGVTVLGGNAHRLNEMPLVRDLIAWSHRLRLFYYYNRPGSPPALLLRSVLGIVLAPFRRRVRAEVRIYAELGAAFTMAFMLLDLVPEVLVPMTRQGMAALAPARIASLWAQEAFMTFLIVYAFAAPIGAVLTLYVLTRRTHTVPRILAVITLSAVAMGAVYAGFP